MNHSKTCLALAAWGMITVSVAQSQEAGPALLERVKGARESFRDLPEDHIVARRQAAQKAMSELDQLLARSRAGYAEGWKKYLRWQDLEAAIAADDADPALLRAALERMRRNNRGLEMPKFLALRDRVAEYVDALAATREKKLQDDYNTAIDDLAKRLEAYQQNPSGLNGPEIARTLAWLKSTGQGNGLATVVQANYSYANLFGRSSERFLATGFNEHVDRVTPVRDNILGTEIHGTARFVGTQVLDMVPSSRDGRFNILVRGTVHSNNLGYNGPVTIRSTGKTSVLATKQLIVNENGLTAIAAASDCHTNSVIHDIMAKCGLIERIAWKKAGKQKGAAEAVASQHAEARINANVNQGAVGAVAQANAAFQEKFRHPLLRRGYPTKKLHISSSNNAVYLEALQMAQSQLGAPSAPPQAQANTDLAVQAHESAVANISEAIIGGVELTDEALAKMLLDATGEIPEELQITDEKEPWSITFADNYPIAATFNGNQAKLYVRANRFTRGRNEDGTVDQDLRGLVEISAVYNIEQVGKGAKLTRQGDVNVDFVGQEKLGAAQITTKTFLRRKFSSLFKPEFAGEGLRLKGRFARAGLLALREVKADQGWITVGWQME